MGRSLFAHSKTRTPCSAPCLCIPHRATPTSNFQKGNTSKTSARSSIRKSNEDEIIDSDSEFDKGCLGGWLCTTKTYGSYSRFDARPCKLYISSVSSSLSGPWIAEEVSFHLVLRGPCCWKERQCRKWLELRNSANFNAMQCNALLVSESFNEAISSILSDGL
jgi:hypothetical protein